VLPKHRDVTLWGAEKIKFEVINCLGITQEHVHHQKFVFAALNLWVVSTA
jgi:hypothetical protein